MSAVVAPAPSSPAPSGGSPASTGVDSGENHQNSGSAHTPTEETQPQTPKRFSRVEKVNGKETTLEATEDELWATYRHNKSVHENARKVAEERKKFESERQKHAEHVQRLKEDPFYALRESGNFDEIEFLQQRLHGVLQDRNRDPRDLALSAKDQELKRLQNQIKERETQEQTTRAKFQEDQELRRDGALMAQALKDGNLPADDLTLEMMLKAHYTALEEEGLELTPVELAKETRRMMTSALDNCADHMNDDQILDAFPKLAQKVHRALVSKYKKQQAGGGQQVVSPPIQNRQQTQSEQPKRMTEREQFEEMQRQAGRRILRGI